MIREVEKILNNDVQAVIKSPELSLSLLRCYSVLFLNGGRPRICEVSQRNYYNKLKLYGMAKAEILEKVKLRTCKPAWKGRKYSPLVMGNIYPDLLHDEQAINYLEIGALKESDFKVLPDGFKKKAAPKKRGPKTKRTK